MKSRRRNPGFHRKEGVIVGQLYRPLEVVGVYVPGGTAAYPSSVLMCAVPAKVAGVSKIVMTTPPGKDEKINPAILVAANEAGVDEIYKVGGAQAVAALALERRQSRKWTKLWGRGTYMWQWQRGRYTAIAILT